MFNVARIAALLVPTDAHKGHLEVATQQNIFGNITDIAVTKAFNLKSYSPQQVIIEGTLITHLGPNDILRPCRVGAFGWVVCNETESSSNEQGLLESLQQWVPDGTNKSMPEHYGYLNSQVAVPGVQQPTSMAYGLMSMLLFVNRRPLYLAGKVVAAPQNGSSTTYHVAFDGWFTTPSFSALLPSMCVPSDDYDVPQTVSGYMTTSDSYNGSGVVEYKFRLQSFYHMGMYNNQQHTIRYPVPPVYPGPQAVPALHFSGNIHTFSSNPQTTAGKEWGSGK
jgi:hypothetical protein